MNTNNSTRETRKNGDFHPNSTPKCAPMSPKCSLAPTQCAVKAALAHLKTALPRRKTELVFPIHRTAKPILSPAPHAQNHIAFSTKIPALPNTKTPTRAIQHAPTARPLLAPKEGRYHHDAPTANLTRNHPDDPDLAEQELRVHPLANDRQSSPGFP